MAVLGTVTMIAVVTAVVAPKAARSAVAALVQIEPGTTTHVGQNESQLVSLVCGTSATPDCGALDANGDLPSAAYVVPSGYTLIVTDWEWTGDGGAPAGALTVNTLHNASGGVYMSSLALVIGTSAYDHEHYLTGLRFGSGTTVVDLLSEIGDREAFIQGYLVPN
jgi:hypothetical protein